MVLLPMPLFWWYTVLAHLFCKLCRLKIGLQFSILLWKYFHIFFQEKRSAATLQNHVDCIWTHPPNLLFNQFWGFFSGGEVGVKRMKSDSDHSLPSTTNVKNEWSYSSPPPLCLHALCVEWPGSHMMDIHILYGGVGRRTLLKSVKKIQVWLKPNKNIWHSTWRPEYIYNYFSLNSPWDEKVSNKWCGENHNTLFTTNTFFSESRAAYKILSKIQHSQKVHRYVAG